ITRTENILHRNFTRRQVAIQNRVASNIGISQSTFSVKVLNLFSRSRRKTNKRKSKHSAMLRNKETRHRMFIGLLNTTRKDRKSGSAGMPRPISYAVFCLKKKKDRRDSMTTAPMFFYHLQSYVYHSHPHSFPTRRSSDLV